MEFHEKLQQLRKKKGLTQEQLAAALFVSRTAVSKWESGRGYPGIDSLKAIAKFFSVTVDELLSGEEILAAAEEDHREKLDRIRDLVFGLLDISAAMLLFLPLFGQNANAVSLLSLSGTAPYLKAVYLLAVICMTVMGILMLALQNCGVKCWLNIKTRISLGLTVLTTFLFILGRQPYAASMLLIYLMIKLSLSIKKR